MTTHPLPRAVTNGQRLVDFDLHTAPEATRDSAIAPGSYYRVLRRIDGFPIPENTYSWVARTPTGEWVALRIGQRGADIHEHPDGTISVAGAIVARHGERWTLTRGQWEAA